MQCILVKSDEFENLCSLLHVYSCFEKGCLAKLCGTMPKRIMGNGGSWSVIEAVTCFSDIEGNSTNKCIDAFSLVNTVKSTPNSFYP